MKKLWKQEEIDFLHEKFGKLDFKTLSVKLNKSEASIRIKCFRLGIKSKISLERHNYYTELELYNYVKKLGYINKPMYKYLVDNQIIKTYGNKHDTKFLTIEEFEKWTNYFNNNYPSIYIKTKIPKKYHDIFEKWLTNKIIKFNVPAENKKIYKYWLYKDEYNLVIDVLNNYIKTNEISKKVGYTTRYIDKLINTGVITNYKRIGAIYWVHKSEIINLKIRIKKLNESNKTSKKKTQRF